MKTGICLVATVILMVCVVDSSAQEQWGNLKGQILLEGLVPEIPKEVINKDVATCLADREAPADDNLVVGKDGGLRDAFVMMYLKKEKPAVHPSYESVLKNPIEIDNKDCRFAPHALFVRAGQVLRMKNSDDVGHNCHGKMFNNEFNINIPTGEFVDLTLKENEKVPGSIVCDIHPWMDAVILVRDEPYVAITDDKGNFEIKNVPAGTWKFQFWHRKTGYMKKLNVPGRKVGRRGEIEIEIKDGETLDLGTLKIAGQEFTK